MILQVPPLQFNSFMKGHPQVTMRGGSWWTGVGLKRNSSVVRVLADITTLLATLGVGVNSRVNVVAFRFQSASAADDLEKPEDVSTKRQADLERPGVDLERPGMSGPRRCIDSCKLIVRP